MNAGEGDDGSGPGDLDAVALVDHDPSWTSAFEQERSALLLHLGASALSVEHVGSTAVPGLRAKPVLDIMVGVRELALPAFQAPLEELGYVHVPIGCRERLFFRKGMPRTHHLHLVLEGGEEQRSHLAFRDWLRGHPEDAREYQDLKERLAERFAHDRDSYTEGKAGFIRGILAKAMDG